MTSRTARRTLRRTRQPDRDSAAPAGRSVPAVAVRPSLCEALEQRMLLALNSPTNLVASQATSLAVNLTWTASPIPPSFSNYQIARSTIPNDPSPQIIGTIPYDQTSYTDVDDVNSPVSPDGRYYYRVRAMAYNADWSPYSNEVEMLPWASRDIGSPQIAGSTSYANGTFTVRGAGTDIEGMADQFQFAYRAVTGSSEAVAKVETQQKTGWSFASGWRKYWAKAGVMFRSTIPEANAQYAAILVTPTSTDPPYVDDNHNNIWLQYRSVSGSYSAYLGHADAAARWVKLTRTDNGGGSSTFRAYLSADGTSWPGTPNFSVTLAGVPSQMYVGLPVTSHDPGVLNTTTFTNVELGVPAAPGGLTATASSNAVALNWTDNSRVESGFTIERSTDGVIFSPVGTAAANAASFSDTSILPGTRYYYRVRATQGSRSSSPSNLAVPLQLGADARQRLHRVTLTWSDVSGETGYAIERSPNGTSGWTQVGTVGANTTSYTDKNLAENTTNYWRVRATGQALDRAYSAVVQATTAAFRAFDSRIGSADHDHENGAVESAFWHSMGADWYGREVTCTPQGGNTIDIDSWTPWSQWDDPRTLRQIVEAWAAAAADTESRLLALEFVWSLNIGDVSQAALDDNICKYEKIFGWVRQAQPSVRVGLYSALPVTGVPFETFNPEDPADLAAMTNANNYLISRLADGTGQDVDFVAPDFYTWFGGTYEWAIGAKFWMEESARYGKPVYPFMWRKYMFTNQDVPTAIWRAQLATVRQYADGVITWEDPGVAYNQNAPWWAELMSYTGTAFGIPSAPGSLTVNPVGAKLTWADVNTNEAGFIIERSEDNGATYAEVGRATRDDNDIQTPVSWTDPGFRSNTAYRYRVAAFNGKHVSAWTTSAATTVTRDAFSRNEGESFDLSRGPWHSGVTPVRHASGWEPGHMTEMGPGDWAKYDDVNFGAGANQFVASVAGGGGFGYGNSAEVWLDAAENPDGSISGGTFLGSLPLKGTHPDPTLWRNFIEQSIGIPLTTGVHDVYLRFTGWGGIIGYVWFARDRAPAAPGWLSATTSDGGQTADLSWVDYSGDENGFIVERSADGIHWTQIAIVPANQTAFSDTSLGNSGITGQVFYRVSAYNSYGDSLQSVYELDL